MSTSHYSRPHRAQIPPPNTRRYTLPKLGTLGLLAAIDIIIVANTQELVEAVIFATLVVINLWFITRSV